MNQSFSKPRRHHFLASLQFSLGWLLCLFVILGNVAWAPAEAAHNRPVRTVADSRPVKPTARGSRAKSASRANSGQAHLSLREGTRIVNQPGYFRISGDRLVFFSTQQNTRYVTLENLNLERIAAAMADQPRQRKWKVTGTMTEYHGDNYLLVEKAVLESWGATVRRSP